MVSEYTNRLLYNVPSLCYNEEKFTKLGDVTTEYRKLKTAKILKTRFRPNSRAKICTRENYQPYGIVNRFHIATVGEKKKELMRV